MAYKGENSGGKRGPGNPGGRPKGSQNKRTQELIEATLKDGNKTPLAYMLEVLNDPKSSMDDKKWAAQCAAPYMHPRLQAAVNPTDPTKPPVTRLEVSFVSA